MRRTSAVRFGAGAVKQCRVEECGIALREWQLHVVRLEVGGEFRLVEGEVAGSYFWECGRYIVGPVSTGMSQCATAP